MQSNTLSFSRHCAAHSSAIVALVSVTSAASRSAAANPRRISATFDISVRLRARKKSAARARLGAHIEPDKFLKSIGNERGLSVDLRSLERKISEDGNAEKVKFCSFLRGEQ